MNIPLIVSTVQYDIVWENPKANLEKISMLLENIDNTDLIVLPEMFTTGFSMEPERIAEEHSENMSTLNWMYDQASKHDAVVLGSVAVKDGEHYYNRMYVAFPNRTNIRYDKNHLFSFGKENEHYKAGTQSLVFEWKSWNIRPLICYDLRFPELARNNWDGDEANYDLLVYSANWPEVRSYPWSTLLRARAIENQAYLIGCNRVGRDGSNINHAGDSVVLDPRGGVIAELKPFEEGVITAQLDDFTLTQFRQAFPVLKDI
jgi:predicted amidohydrolase